MSEPKVQRKIENFGWSGMAYGLFGSVLLFIALPAMSCSLYLGVTLIFDENSSVIVASETARLSEWANYIRAEHPENDGIILSVGVETTESDVEQLGRMRELATRLALIDQNIYTKIIFTSDKIHPTPKGAWGARRENDIKHVAIQYIPTRKDFYEPCMK